MLFSNLETYDPLTIDTSPFDEVSKKIPKTGQIDLSSAEQLATIFLSCADTITDEIACCSAYLGYCEAACKEAKAKSIDDRVEGNGVKKVVGTIAVQTYAEDVRFIEARKKFALAEALLEWLRTKYRNFMAAHVLCKDVLKVYADQKQKGGFARQSYPHDLESDENAQMTSESNVRDSDGEDFNGIKNIPSPGADRW